MTNTDGPRPWPHTRPSLLRQLHDPAAREAWQTFVALYTPLVYRHCRRRGLQHADALDLTQDVITKVAAFRYDPAQGRFRGWPSTVTYHAICRFWKQQGRRPEADGPAVDPAAVATAGADFDWARLARARLLETAVDRVRPEFSDAEWAAYSAVAPPPADGPAAAPCPASVARAAGQPVGWVYKVKWRVLRRLRAEVVTLAEGLGVLA